MPECSEKKRRHQKRGGNLRKRRERRNISRGYLDLLVSKVDIVEVIREYLPLKRRSCQSTDEWLCLCPFHAEKHASFIVSGRKQFFHCFGCGDHGDVISFLMKYNRLEFFEGVMVLAKRTGVYPNEWRKKHKRESVKPKNILVVNNGARKESIPF